MDTPQTKYVKTPDGVYIAYQTVGEWFRGLEISAGVHTAECELIDGKIGGITVSIGARRRDYGRVRGVSRRP